MFFPTTRNLSTETDDTRSPNTINSITFSIWKLKFSSSLSGSPISSGYWKVSLASYIEFKPNISTKWSLKITIGIVGTWSCKTRCFHCRNIKAPFISNIDVYNWLIPSEYFNLSEINLLTPKWIFSIRFSKCRVCVHCNGISTNWSIVENIFLNELAWSGRNDENLCWGPRKNEFHKSICKHVHSFFVMFLFESNTTSVEWVFNNSKKNVWVVTDHVQN